MNPPLFVSAVEPLESRIAPATLSFIDVDGDHVVVTTSKGTDGDLAAAAIFADSGAGKILQKLDLASHPIFKGTDITVTSLNGTDPSTVDIGYIDATGLDLHDVTIPGDLGQLDVGDSKMSTPALHSLTVNSLGTLGALTQGANFSIVSDIKGTVDTFTVHGVVKATVNVTGGAQGRINTLVVDGDLAGDAQALSGSFFVKGAIGKATLHNLVGGTAASTGAIEARSIGELNILGDVIGGPADHAGSVKVSTNIDQLTVSGNLIGGTGVLAKHSGEIRASRTIGTATIHGYLKGGEGDNSGALAAGISLGDVTVDGGLKGGVGLESGTVGSAGTIVKATIGTGLVGGFGERSGSVLATAKITDVTVNGTVEGGKGKHSATIGTDGVIQSVTVNGDVIGGSGEESGAIGSRKAFGSITITGNLEGGVGLRSGTVLSSRGIESVVVGGNVYGGSGHESGVVGALGVLKSVKVGSDVMGGSGDYSGSVVSASRIENVEITGSLRGYPGVLAIAPAQATAAAAAVVEPDKDGTGSGTVRSAGTIGFAEVKQNVEGGIGAGSGAISAEIRLEQAVVDGSIYGSYGGFSGSITGSRVEEVFVGGMIQGGGGNESGSIQALGGKSAVLGSVHVGGDVRGGDGNQSGFIFSTGRIDSVVIGTGDLIPTVMAKGRVASGSLAGGSGFDSGTILSQGDIGTISIAYNIEGGEGTSSGHIFAGRNLTQLTVGNSMYGGGDNVDGSTESALAIGQVYARGRIGLAQFGNSIYGGFGDHSGAISAGSIGTVTVERNVSGGFGTYSGSITTTVGDIAAIQIGGELTTDAGDGASRQSHAAAISATRNLGEVEIGSLRGYSGSEVTISAGGKLNPQSNAQALAIRSITVTGDVAYANILAGYIPGASFDGTAVNPDAQIGTVTVGASGTDSSGVTSRFLSSNIAAGVTRGSDGYFATPDDQSILTTQKTSSLISRIAKVVINGSVVGRDVSQTGYFGIVAENVVSVSIGGTPEPLHAGPFNDSFTIAADTTGSTRIQELRAGLEAD